MALRTGKTIRTGLCVYATLLFLAARPCAATIVGGGGGKTKDCLGVFDAPVNSPAGKPHNVTSIDGKPCDPNNPGQACDADGVVNGVCEIDVIYCGNSTALPACMLKGIQNVTVAHALDNGDPDFDPEFQAMQTRIDNDVLPHNETADVCTTATHFHVRIKGPLGNNHCGKRTKKLQITTVSENFGGRVYTDKDTIKLTCIPADDTVGGCDPQTLFASTYDRIQRQIFDQSCAVSGCHDSQTHQKDLILESGAALTNLINVTPMNAAAAAAGWKRITQIDLDHGDPDTSYIVHKVDGDLPDASFGPRMPFGRPKLNGTLRDIIRLWVLDGASDTRWVPGTF
jgi:hypothetical protein